MRRRPRRPWWSLAWGLKWGVSSLMRAVRRATCTSGLPVSPVPRACAETISALVVASIAFPWNWRFDLRWGWNGSNVRSTARWPETREIVPEPGLGPCRGGPSPPRRGDGRKSALLREPGLQAAHAFLQAAGILRGEAPAQPALRFRREGVAWRDAEARFRHQALG